MPLKFQVFPDNPAVAKAFANDVVQLINSLLENQEIVSVSLSGGSTPKLLFEILATQYAISVDWARVHFFWGDERCVEPTDPESNFGEANRLFLSVINLPNANVHRVFGEADPAEECVRYEADIRESLEEDNGVPVFDIMILGMGADGHTASIFPHQMELMTSDRVCEIATHPESGQKRISLTGPVLNAAKHVFFLVTGASKADVLFEIDRQQGDYRSYPTSHVAPRNGCQFYVDQAAYAKF